MTEQTEAPIIVDIWGGHMSGDHVARFILPVEEALSKARTELVKGYLVNLRAEAAFGPDGDFDERGMVQ